MKAKYLLPLTAAAMFAMTACSVEADDDESLEPLPPSSSSIEVPPTSSNSYEFVSRINQVEKSAKTYCSTKSENAGLNGYLDASITGFGTVAVTVTQDMSAKTIETILEIKVDGDEATVKDACDAMIDETDVYSSCDLANNTIVSIVLEPTDHIMNNTTMTKSLDELCGVFTELEQEMIPEDASYGYKYLTYCEIIPGANEADGTFYDCEELPVKKVDAATVSFKAQADGSYIVGAYFGDEDDKGIIEDTYTLVGFDTDDLGSYWEFTGEEDLVRVYGPDFAVMRAKDDSYYYSWSMFEDVYKKIALKLKAKAIKK